jgi:hypothetical protein
MRAEKSSLVGFLGRRYQGVSPFSLNRLYPSFRHQKFALSLRAERDMVADQKNEP